MSENSECPRYRVGITFNLKQKKDDENEDEQAEYDSIGTIEAISEAIGKTGCETIFLEADTSLPQKLQNLNPDIVFNIAEGKAEEAGRPRYHQFLTCIQYLSQDPTKQRCVALDKGLTKRIVKSCRIKTPVFCLENKDTEIPANLRFPVIVKPNAEGSSKGILGNTIAGSRKELINLLHEKLDRYNQPLLIEEYIQGREFTVGILGNGSEKHIFRPMEIIISPEGNPDKSKVYSFHVKTNYQKYVKYRCPADLDPDTEEKMSRYSAKIYELLECRDFARIDYILSEDNEIYFIEINPLPGLAPGYSDYPMLAEYNGVGYDELVKAILNSGLRRYGMSAV